jgi:hypothetical protein
VTDADIKVNGCAGALWSYRRQSEGIMLELQSMFGMIA